MRRVLPVVSLIALLGALALPPAVRAQSPSTLRMAISQDDKNWTPYTYQTGYPGYPVLTLFYDTLLWHDKNNEVIPWLAEEFKVSADGLAIDVVLRDGATWHDGRPVTSDDVKFTYDYIQEFNHGRFTPQVKGVVDSVTTDGPQRATFRLKEPKASFLTAPLADVAILPKHIWEGIRENYPSKKGEQGLAVGSGPYKMVEHQPDKFYRLEANASYFMGKPAVDQLTLQVIPDFNAQVLALRSGEIDVVARNLTPELVRELGNAPGIKVATGPDYTTAALVMNTSRSPFDQVKFRQAVASAVDVDDIVRSVLAGFGTPGSPGYVHPESPFYKKGLRHELNLTRANALLDEAGFGTRDQDGIRRSTDGKRLEFEILTANIDPIRVRAAEVVGSQLAKVGIKASVLSLTSAAVAERTGGFGGQIAERNFDFLMSGATAPVQDDPDRLRTVLQTGANLNAGKWSDERFDAALAAQSGELDRAKRLPKLHEMQDLIATERPVVVLYYQNGGYAYRTAAYDDWTYVKGKGIVDKVSFVSHEVDDRQVTAPAQQGGEQADDSPNAAIGAVVAAGVVALLALVLRKSRRGRSEQE